MRKSKAIIAIFIILAATFCAFLPSLNNGFVNWDDDVFIIDNSLIKEFSWSNIGKIISSPHQDVYKPVVFLGIALEYHFFKLDPFYYHLVNLIFHLVNSLLVFWLIFLISGSLGVSFITGLLFGIHPLHVQSVAWAFQFKDMLYGFFFLWALILYLYYRKSGLRRYYYLALASFVLSLFSKPMGLAFPFVLLCIDYLQKRKVTPGVFLEKIPFALFSFGIAMASFTFSDLSVNSRWADPKAFLLIPYQLAHYLKNTFFPLKLSSFYPAVTKLEVFQAPFNYISPLLLTCLALTVIFSKKYTRKIIFGSLFLLLLLFPVLVSHTYEAAYPVADHFMYLALIGIAYIFAEGFSWFYRKKAAASPALKIILIALFLFVTAILSGLTWKRCQVWKDSLTLWNDVLKNYPVIGTAYINRGQVFLDKKEYGLAASDFERAAALEPDAPEPYIDLCALYIMRKEYTRAIELCNSRIAGGAGQEAKIYLNLGMAYNGLGETQEARAALNKALALDPDYLDVYYGLAEIYLKEGDIKKAMDCYEQVIAKDPYSPNTYNHLAGMQMKLGNHQEVIKLSRKILEFEPQSSQAYCNLGSAYGSLGDFNASIGYSLQALKLDPGLALAHSNLAVAYFYTGQYGLAIEHCDKAVKLGAAVNPDFLKQLEGFRKQ